MHQCIWKSSPYLKDKSYIYSLKVKYCCLIACMLSKLSKAQFFGTALWVLHYENVRFTWNIDFNEYVVISEGRLSSLLSPSPRFLSPVSRLLPVSNTYEKAVYGPIQFGMDLEGNDDFVNINKWILNGYFFLFFIK